MTEQEQYNDAMSGLIAYENEVKKHNDSLLKDIDCEDLQKILEGTRITGKIELAEQPLFEPEYNPEVCGIFTLKYVDQWGVGIEGDCFEGFMYIEIEGHDKFLKVPYSC